jgi:hypothetical protein
MLLLFPCPGTIPVPSCWPSCQMSCCAPPLSGCISAASSRLSTAPMTAPTPSCGRELPPSPSGLVRGTRLSPSAPSRPAQKRTPHQAVRDAAADHGASARAVPPPPSQSHFADPLISSPSSPASPRDSPGTIFLPS